MEDLHNSLVMLYIAYNEFIYSHISQLLFGFTQCRLLSNSLQQPDLRYIIKSKSDFGRLKVSKVQKLASENPYNIKRHFLYFLRDNNKNHIIHCQSLSIMATSYQTCLNLPYCITASLYICYLGNFKNMFAYFPISIVFTSSQTS